MSPYTYLAYLYSIRRDSRNFITEFKRSAELSHDQSAAFVAAAAENAFSTGGSPGMLESMLKVQKELYLQGKEPAYLVARTASLLGRRDETFAYLQAALERREMLVLDIGFDLAFANLHGDPSWVPLVAKVRSGG